MAEVKRLISNNPIAIDDTTARLQVDATLAGGGGTIGTVDQGTGGTSACKCGHIQVNHDQSKPQHPCNFQGCECKQYLMAGKAYVLPEDSYPFKVDPPKV